MTAPSSDFVQAILHNIDHTRRLFEGAGAKPAALLATVSGSASSQRFWQHRLDLTKGDFGCRQALSLHEDLPVNQALGVLLLWQRVKSHFDPAGGALAAFVFGDGTRATPFTETDNGQKPAIMSFVKAPQTSAASGSRYLSMVELALLYFAPVEDYLRRSGFKGLVIKWGDEVQIPSTPLDGTDPRFTDADVVRFVSMRPMTPDQAMNKDWVGVDPGGNITAFIPRRPLSEMHALADRGLLQRRGEELWGGINLGSIALSQALLDELLSEFEAEVADESALRGDRPDLDPQMFTALTIAAIEDDHERRRAWETALDESGAMQNLQTKMPSLLPRLCQVLQRFQERYGRPVRMVAMDFGEPYWGDIGQHREIYEFFMALNDPGERGQIARALAGIDAQRDERGNLLVGDVRLSPDVEVRNSVLMDCQLLGRGHVTDSVLIGTATGDVEARQAFDVLSTVGELRLAARAGSYKVVSAGSIIAEEEERLTTLFLPNDITQLRVCESTDLRQRELNYDAPLPGNTMSFRRAHELMLEMDPGEVQQRRDHARQAVLARLTRG